MILYHGSNCNIAEIDLSKSKVGKDFGCGFYLSADEQQARELAERKTEQMGIGTPTLTVYSFDEKSLHNKEISVLIFQSYSKEWAEFVLMNIDMDKFLEELKYMKGITMQYFFGTEKAISFLNKIDRL